MIILHILKVVRIIIEVLVIFNLMIIVHELGHFLTARWRGLKIEKFGVWFGKPLWKKKVNGVEYSLGSIPFGGFVALPQLASMEGFEGESETPQDQLPPISALDKIIVAFAGPLFSFLLAVTFAIIVWQAGRPLSEAESTTVIGIVGEDMPAQAAGLMVGDKIIAVDGHPVTRFNGMSSDSIQWSIVRSENSTINVVVEREENGKTEKKTIAVTPETAQKAHWWNRSNLRSIGIGPSTSSVVAKVKPDSAGAKAGLQKDDIITAINGQKLYSPDGIYDYIKDHPVGPFHLTVERPEGPADESIAKRPRKSMPLDFDPKGILIVAVEKETPAAAAGLQKDDVVLSADGKEMNSVFEFIDYIGAHADKTVALQVQRDGKAQEIKVTPQVPLGLPDGMKKLGKIGIVPDNTDGVMFDNMGISSLVHPKPLEQVRLSFMAIVNTLDGVISRKSSISVQHMGGPVMMMNAYYHMLSSPEGIRMAIWFSVVLNVNLALLNLLPIPPLDGSHITLAILEAIRRKPMNPRIWEYVQATFTVLIVGFMILILFFDVQDLPFVGGKRPTLHFQKVGEEAK
ncbi:peptidase M50 [Chthoniobacter flavus Ellin428]|uniref:Peptidase M50 n=1 Tax=Chthoniobacter flavus Ellin428 TaxID=497964 RepID=B4D7P4_9BACT|nr:site-2 protease family protein [Chthoniobacter flavus]EDY17534.1 peptidase M50 [Chthoniobacter flavus Ellin428]TCO92432.1 RIP metalloprotease RseP [Chthoniobacter flavus]